MDFIMVFKIINLFCLGCALFAILFRPFYYILNIKENLVEVLLRILVYTLYANVVYLSIGVYIVFGRWLLY